MRILEGLGLEYETHGEGESVLLIHGSHIADSFLPWNKEPALAGYRLIRYHRRGFAGSQAVSHAFSIEQQAHDALALLKFLGVGRAHVIGNCTAARLPSSSPSRPRMSCALWCCWSRHS